MKKLICFLIILTISLQLFAQVEELQNFSEINSSGNTEFGNSVSSAGDFNNDGFDDFIVGAPEYNSGQGRAYLYLGGSSLNNSIDLTLNAENYFDEFGKVVSSAGDINNDGYADIIIGAPGYANNKGRAYIYFGSSQGNLNDVPDVILTGEVQSDNFGFSVSGAGDVNNDGYDDVVIGAHIHDVKGRAYIFFGGTSMDNTPDVVLNGESNWSYFGISVSSAGDVNNDGFSDVLIGSYGYNSNQGRAYLYYGATGSTMDITADVIFTGETTSDNFGGSVSSAGDVNNDGFDDILIGANQYNNNRGRAYIYFGSTGLSMNNTVDVIITGTSIGDQLGHSVSSAGDVNKDNFDDVIIGVKLFENKAYIFLGATGATMDNNVDVTLTGANSNSKFGISVSSAGDINNDGFYDVIVGSPSDNSNAGRADVFTGLTNMDSSTDLILTGELGFGNKFGTSLASAGDLNNDGFEDTIIGAPSYDDNTGRAYIYFGSADTPPDNNVDVVLTGVSAGENFGSSVSSAGDVNNDGYDDVIVGASEYGSSKGRAYIYFGSAGTSMDNNADVTLTGSADYSSFGISVSTAGDINNDNYDDVVVGESGYSSSTGRAYIFLGGSSMNNSADITLTGEGNFNYFGISVSSAGDVNNDNYDDIIVGARGYSSDKGRAYIYFGGSSMNNSTDVTFTGEEIGDYFGVSVSSAGDVNNDGYGDVVVGASRNNTYRGRAYVYLGAAGISMDNIIDVTLSGSDAYNYFGSTVTHASDLNNDGVSDIIVGCNEFSSTYDFNYVYIYFGTSGTLMDNTPDLTLSSELAGSNFGKSVSFIGDMNGDTQPDFIVGAPDYPGNGQVFAYSMPSLMISDDFLVTILQNETYTFSEEDFTFNDAAQGAPQGIIITSLESEGFLQYDGEDVVLDNYYSDFEKLLFVPVPNESGNNYSFFKFKAKNSSGIFGNESKVTINITQNNTPPLGGSNTFTIDEDSQKTFNTSEFNYSDYENSPMQQIQITTFPEKGTLYNDLNKDGEIANGELIFIDSLIAKADIDSRQLKFKPDNNDNGTPYTLFNFRVHDGTDYSASYYSININVEPINDPPTGSNNAITIARSVPYVFSSSDFTFKDLDGHAFNGIQVTQLESAGELRYNNIHVTSNMVCSDISKLKFTPEPEKTGFPYATFKFKVRDISGELSTVSYDMNINVSASVSQPPYIIVNRGFSVSEGSTFTLSNSILEANDPDGSDYSITYNVTSGPSYGTLNKGTFLLKTEKIETTSFTQEEIAANRISYTHNGTDVTSDKFTFTLQDGNGTTSHEYECNITIVGTNEPPVISTLPSIQFNEDETFTLDLSTWYDYVQDAETPDAQLIYDLSIDDSKIQLSSILNSKCTITPDPNYFTNTFLNVHISDGEFGSTQQVPLKVESINDLPIITGLPSSTLNIAPATEYNIAVSIDDVETSNTDLVIGTIADPDSLDANYNKATGFLSLTPSNGFYGLMELTLYVLDTDLGFVSETVTINVQRNVSGMEDLSGLPNQVKLAQNYPNPFNPSTAIRFGIPDSRYVTLKVFDSLGNEVASLQDGALSSGFHERTWYAENVSSGIYFYMLSAGDYREIKKMILLK